MVGGCGESILLLPQTRIANDDNVMRLKTQWLCGWLGLLLAACSSSRTATDEAGTGPLELALGPLMYAHPLTLEEGREAGFLGPFFYEKHGTENNQTYTQKSFRPILTTYRTDDNSTETTELLFPLLTYHRTGKEYRVQIGQMIGFSGSGYDEFGLKYSWKRGYIEWFLTVGTLARRTAAAN